MKTVKTLYRHDRLVKAQIVLDEDFDEYQVMLYKAGRLEKDATYHTDSYQDALGTARLMVTT